MAVEPWNMLFVALTTAVIAVLLAWPFVDVSLGGDHYVVLARRLAHGSINVDNLAGPYGDIIRWNGHIYLPFGPLPAILLIPFLPSLNAGLPLVVIGYLFSCLNVVLFYRVLANAGVSAERRKWTTLLYFAGTPYLGIALVGISTYFAHIVTTTFLLFAMLEGERRGRAAIIGLLVGTAAAARMTALFTLPFFVWPRIFGDTRSTSAGGNASKKGRVHWLTWLSIGVAVPLLFLAVYNYMRFGNAAETGFGIALLYDPILSDARSAGLFSAAHIPKNFFMMLLKGPDAVGGDSTAILNFPYVRPSKWGMGLFFTSPALLYAFRADLRERRVQALWAGVIATAIPILCYYGIGFVQFGYRYALDFMPLLALIVAKGMPDPLTPRARLLVAASVLINLWGAIYLATWI
jgi:hypothetical protein